MIIAVGVDTRIQTDFTLPPRRSPSNETDFSSPTNSCAATTRSSNPRSPRFASSGIATASSSTR